MSNASRFLISVFCVYILTIGTISLQAQISKQNNAELPSINQQTETDDNTLQEQKPRDKTPKKRPYLIKKHVRKNAFPIGQGLTRPYNGANLLPSPVNNTIQPIKDSTDFPLIKLPTDFQIPLHLLHPKISMLTIMNRYKQGKLELDYVVDYLESQHHFDPAILDKLEPRRAFRYISRTSASMGGAKTEEIAKAYAERILAKDPDNPDAQLHMVRYEKDDTKIIQRYKQILAQHPNHPDTLSALGYTLHDNSPEEALQYLRKANKLDPTVGIFSLGLVYEKLGDFKSAWFCYKKTVLNRKRWKARFPPSRIHEDFFIDEMKLSAIGGGDQWKSVKEYVRDPNGKPIRIVRTFQTIDAQQKREIDEFFQFRDWVWNIENRKNINQNNDFLVIEIWKHLNGGKPMFDPERIVRAYEITTRVPGDDGIQLLKKTDPEVAGEIERLLQKE